MRPIVTDRVARSVGLSIGRFVTLMSPAKTAEPIEVPFELRTRVGPTTMYIRCDPYSPPWEGVFLWEKGRPIVKYRDTLWSSVQKRLNPSRCCLSCGSDGAKQSDIRWGPDSPMGRGNFGERVTHCKVQGLSAVSCAKTA